MALEDYPPLAPAADWSVSRVYFPAGRYRHGPTGLMQLRVIRRGSSEAHLDLGAGLGLREVYTRPGDLLLTLPDRPSELSIDDGRELTLLQVVPEVAETVLRQCGATSLEDLSPLLRGPFREPLIAEVLRRLENNRPDTPAGRRWALGMIMASLVYAARGDVYPVRHAGLPLLTAELIAARLRSDITRTWTITEMAAEFGVSERAVTSMIRHATGTTPHQYLIRLRLEYAEKLLHETDLPVAEIADRSGFSSQAHLTRTFNRLRGVTPGSSRAQRRSR